jgi:hypothetical protein
MIASAVAYYIILEKTEKLNGYIKMIGIAYDRYFYKYFIF